MALHGAEIFDPMVMNTMEQQPVKYDTLVTPWKTLLKDINGRKRDKEAYILTILNTEMLSRNPRLTVVDRLSSMIFRIRARRQKEELMTYAKKANNA